MIRRALVLGTLVLVVVGAFTLVRMVARSGGVADGSGRSPAGAEGSRGTDGGTPETPGTGGGSAEADAAAAGAGADGSLVPPGSTAAPTTTEPAGPRVPSAAAPARILLVGDSQAQGLEPFLEPVLDSDDLDPLTALTTFGKNSSGLVRPDFFDWPAKLRELVASEQPDIVVMFIGGNETQQFLDMPGKPIDSPEWRAEYGRRVGEVADILRADHRTLIWIGVPMPGEEWQRSRLAVQNEVVREQLAARPDTVFVDTWVLFAGIDGSYAPFVLDPLTGKYGVVRSERDDFHLNVAGSKALAEVVGQHIRADLRERGVDGIGDGPTLHLGGPGTYTIDNNDSLSAIARRTGTTVAAIVAANGWADHNHVIIPGQDILLPARGA